MEASSTSMFQRLWPAYKRVHVFTAQSTYTDVAAPAHLYTQICTRSIASKYGLQVNFTSSCFVCLCLLDSVMQNFSLCSQLWEGICRKQKLTGVNVTPFNSPREKGELQTKHVEKTQEPGDHVWNRQKGNSEINLAKSFSKGGLI